MMERTKVLSMVAVLALLMGSGAQAALVDDFESYPAGGGVVELNATGVWTATNSQNDWRIGVRTTDNLPDNGNMLRAHSGGTTAYRALPQWAQIAQGQTKTFFFQLAANGGGMAHHIGLTEGDGTSFGNFKTQFSFIGGHTVAVRDGGSAPDVGSYGSGSSLPLNNVWLVIDNSDGGSYRVYMNQGLDNATEDDRLSADGTDTFAFRTASTGTLDTILLVTGNTTNIGWYDNMYVVDGVSLANPIPEPATLALLGLGGLTALKCRKRR